MNDEEYLEHCRALLAEFSGTLATRTRELPEDHPLRALSVAFEQLSGSRDALYTDGPVLVARLFDGFPEFAPTFPRQLLWFFGGECLHYMADEEIDRFQALDDMRRDAADRGERLDLAETRARLLKLH